MSVEKLSPELVALLKPVSSSNIAAIGFDSVLDPATGELSGEDVTGRLYVQFKARRGDAAEGRPGEVYCYDNVPFSVFVELADAPSVGAAFEALIKGVFRCWKLVGEVVSS